MATMGYAKLFYVMVENTNLSLNNNSKLYAYQDNETPFLWLQI